ELTVLTPAESDEMPPAPTEMCVPTRLLLRANAEPVNWMALTLTLPTSTTLVVRTAAVRLKTMVGLGALRGVPPARQLLGLDQRVLTAPVQRCEAGVQRSSSDSSMGRTGRRGFLAPRRSQLIQVEGLIAILLRCLSGKLVCDRMNVPCPG